MPVTTEPGPVLADVVIELSGSLSLNDFRTANRLSKPLWKRFTAWGFTGILAAMTLLGVVLVMGRDGSDKNTRVVGGMLFGLSGYLLAMVALRLWLNRLKFGRLARQQRACFAYAQTRIDKNAIHSVTSSMVTTAKWEAFRGFRECRNVVVLYYLDYPGLWAVVARAKFKSEADWQAFRQLVASKLRPV